MFGTTSSIPEYSVDIFYAFTDVVQYPCTRVYLYYVSSLAFFYVSL